MPYPCAQCHKTVPNKLHICQGSSKQKYGQFFTTNVQHILQGLEIPTGVKYIIEPFAGNCDLLKFVDESKYRIDCYDIEPKQSRIVKRDTILNPLSYQNAWIISNPPYLARNKAQDKSLFDKYQVNDLYKCFFKELLTNKCLGGIVIVPINFWSSIRKADVELRKQFLAQYRIIRLNIFEEQVFSDTTSTVCSFQFEQGVTEQISITLFPSKATISATLTESNNYSVGGEIYNLPIKV
jgi:hypothetical protein